MACAIGFSAGDIISGIILVKNLIQALQESRGSSREFVDVIRGLCSLERALVEVSTLPFNSQECVQHAALLQAVGHCRCSMDTFIASISKYQPHLGTGGSLDDCL